MQKIIYSVIDLCFHVTYDSYNIQCLGTYAGNSFSSVWKICVFILGVICYSKFWLRFFLRYIFVKWNNRVSYFTVNMSEFIRTVHCLHKNCALKKHKELIAMTMVGLRTNDVVLWTWCLVCIPPEYLSLWVPLYYVQVSVALIKLIPLRGWHR